MNKLLTCNGEAPQIRQDGDLRRIIRATIPIKNDKYFQDCARIRGISLRALMIRLVDTISQDLMVGSILDDQDELKTKRRYENRHRDSVQPKAV